MSQVWFTQKQAAKQVLLISEATLCRYTTLGIGPRSVKIGNGRRFSIQWLEQWILEGGVTRPDRAAVLRAANRLAAMSRRSAVVHVPTE